MPSMVINILKHSIHLIDRYSQQEQGQSGPGHTQYGGSLCPLTPGYSDQRVRNCGSVQTTDQRKPGGEAERGVGFLSLN